MSHPQQSPPQNLYVMYTGGDDFDKVRILCPYCPQNGQWQTPEIQINTIKSKRSHILQSHKAQIQEGISVRDQVLREIGALRTKREHSTTWYLPIRCLPKQDSVQALKCPATTYIGNVISIQLNEILTCIVSYFPSLDDTVAFSKTCTAFDALFTEEDWQRAARRFNYGRPNACVNNTWKKYVAVLVKHAAKCAFCKGVHAEFATIQNTSDGILHTKEALQAHPTVAIASFLERRPSEDDMYCPDTFHLVASLGGAKSTPLEERCTISYVGLDQLKAVYKERKGKSMSEKVINKQRRLVGHINAMSLFATTIPIKQLSLLNFLDAESPYFDMMMEDDLDYFSNKPSLLYPATVINENGLTCDDVMRAGANWKVDPGYNASFGGLVLDKKSATLYYEYVGSCNF